MPRPPVETRTSAHPALDAFARTLDQGVYDALGFLNARTRHRYTGTYLFDPPLLRSHCLFDREVPGVRSMADLVLRDSYCGIVAERNAPLVVENSLEDARLADHPARALMLAYHGYPLRDETGSCFGTLCHWDVRPRLTPAEEIPLLEHAAALLGTVVLAAARGRREPAGGLHPRR